MRHIALYCCAIVLAGCGGSKDQPPADEMAADTTAAPAAPAPLALSDIAGKWNINVMSESGDTTYFTFEMVATADTSGWAFNFPKGKAVPVRVVAVEGDSVVTEAGPFESNIRKGVQTTARTVNRVQDGKLVGMTTAHYKVKGADTVATYRFEGSRAP